jgi:SNF2 family DNA or RNA helicase
MSYHHVEWLPKSQIEESKMGKTRVKKFLEKPLFEIQWSEDEPFNPSYLKVDRIIDEGELEDDVYFLVKWASQTYDQSTWETQQFIHQLDPEKIQEFHRRKILSNEKEESYLEPHRPSPNEWKQLKESPLYKNDNELRAYQLEGLNWLLYCWYHRQNSILADEMGLGKTIQSTAFLNEIFLHNNVKGPFLIITPLSTLGNWEREVKAWTEMNIVVYHGKETSRNLLVETEFYYKDAHGDIIPEIFKFDVLLTTYEMAIAGCKVVSSLFIV